MAASAAFHFDSQASLLKKSATPAGTVTLTLDSVTGVDSILWTVSLTCENSAGDWTISGSTANNATLTVPNVSGIACIIQCRVNGGTRVDPTTGVQSVGDLVKTAKVYTGAEVIVTGETTESDATYGWAPVINATITGGGGVSLSNVAPSAIGTASAGAGADASRYDHVHAHGNQLGGTLHADASGAGAGFMTAGHYTLVNTAAEAPTVSVIPIRTSGGNLRCVGATCETATDADRYVRGTGADGTTLAAMRVEGSSVVLGGKNADATNKLTCTQAADGSALTLAVTSSAAASNPLTVASTALKLLGTSQKCADASDAYGQTYTPAAAATLVYANDLTSLTDRIAQKAAGAGAARYILGGLGASGSANGVFVSGLENGNTVLGGEHWLACGSLVANVSDKVRFGTGTPGSMTSFLDVFQPASGYARIAAPAILQVNGGTGLSLDAGSGVVALSGASIDAAVSFLDNRGQYTSTPDAVTYAAALTVNCNNANYHTVTLTGNVTSLTLSNARAGSTHVLEFTQDGAGGRTLAGVSANFKDDLGGTDTMSFDTAANHVTRITVDVISSTVWRVVKKNTYAA